MKNAIRSVCASLLVSAVPLGLTGCIVTGALPNADAVVASPQTSIPAIQGSNYGGHAPIVGAHIFLLQASTNGYGAQVTSLLTGAGANAAYPTALDTATGSPTNGMYYVTSDNTGQFSLTGDYTCTAGLPVWIYGAGGNPMTNPTNMYTVTITGATGSIDTAGNLLVTFSTTGNQLLYQGESIQFGAVPSPYAAFTNTIQVVSPIGLTTTSFSVELGPATSSPGNTGTFNSTVTQVNPTTSFNPAIANMAMLGLCPGQFTISGIPTGNSTNTLSGISGADLAKLTVGDTILGPGINGATISSIDSVTHTVTMSAADTGGNPAGPYYSYEVTTGTNQFNFGPTSSTPISYVYMNEVSTVAAAYALAPFASTTANNDALHIGTSSTNLSGLQHAAANAANLYDISGGNIGTGGNGDAHIARTTALTNTNGTVPQSLIDRLGNILANCVDSANLYGVTSTSATESSQCAVLFGAATSTGTSSGTRPYDTATAALNIALHPAGSGAMTNCGGTTVSAFACTLFNSPTGNVPFVPDLSVAPNDFTIGIAYSGNGLTGANGVAVDASGDVWVPTAQGIVVELGPNGSVLSGSSGYSSGTTNSNSNIAIDGGGNAWFINNFSTVMKMNSYGTLLSGTGYSTGSTPTPCLTGPPTPHGLALDGNNNVWVVNYYGDDIGQSIAELNNAGTIIQDINTNNNTCNNTTTGNTVVRNLWSTAIDGNGVVYSTGYSSENVAGVNTLTTNGSWTLYNNSGSTAVPDGPGYLAVDQNNKVWVPNFYGVNGGVNSPGYGSSVSVFTPGSIASATTDSTVSLPYTSYSGGGLVGPQAIAIDGGNNIWITGIANNIGSKYVSEFNNSGTALTPSTGYTGGITNYVGRVAIDSAGSVWINSSPGNDVVQMIGVATPVTTPIATAAKNGVPAAKP